MTLFPLTPMQTAMLVETQLGGHARANIEQIVLDLPDELACTPDRLRDLWARLADHHAMLRATLCLDTGGTVHAHVAPRIDVIPDAGTVAHLERDRQTPFAPALDPAWRLALRGDGGRVVFSFHHALLDGRSFDRVLVDFLKLLAGEGLGAAGDFPAHAAAVAAHPDDGTAHFAPLLAGLDSSPDWPRAGRMATLARDLTADRRDRISASAAQAGASLADAVNAAWAIVLARAAGGADAVIGVTRSGRFVCPASAEAVGCLIATLPLRLRIAPDLTLRDVLAQARAQTLALQRLEHVDPARLRALTDLAPDAPLFGSAVMFERGTLGQRLARQHPLGARVQAELHEEGTLPLTLSAYDDTGLALRLEHDSAVVQASGLFDALVTLLDTIAAGDIDQPLEQIDTLPAAQRAHLLALGAPTGPVTTAPDVLDRIAAQDPDAPALSVIGHTAYSYARINASADALAAALAARGARPGARIAICLPRSPEFVIAMLAVLKTGAAWVPVDPTYPRDAIRHMLTDSGAVMAVARDAPPEALPEALPVIDPVQPPAAFAGQARDPNSAAYVIYTSGSTGLPKGVEISRAALASHAQAAMDRYGLVRTDKALQFASLSFDVSIEEIIPTLCAGAHLVLRDDTLPESFWPRVRAAGITVLNLPTAFWQTLVDDLRAQDLPETLRLTIVGGERIAPPALAKWRMLVPGAKWLNGYGPTETTITATVFDPDETGPLSGDVPIGRVMGHAHAYVLGADGTLAPMGVRGELWIGGAAVALGYLNRPDLTAQRFRPDPFNGGRMYRTGDLASWRADGQLAYHGRADRQVKLRGFRIELGEIEARLEALPGVARAFAALDGTGAAARLLAWVVAEPGASPDLRGALDGLPAHMRAPVLLVQDLPKTPGGKVDLARLPRPSTAQATTDTQPLTPEAQVLADLMATLLGQPLAPGQGFFDAGGTSLLALRLIARIEAATGWRPTLAQLHADPTPQGLASAREAAGGVLNYVVPITDAPGLAIYGVHVMGPNESFFRPLAAALGPDQAVYGLTVGLPRRDTPWQVPDLARGYFDDIQRHRPEGPIALAAVSLGAYCAMDLARLLRAAGREVVGVFLFDAAGPKGRPRKKGWAKIAAHLGQVLRHGPGYVTDKLRARAETRAIATALDTPADDPEGEIPMEQFVALNERGVAMFQPQVYDGPVTILQALDDPFDTSETAKALLGWRGVLTQAEVVPVAGGHLTMLAAPHVSGVAQVIRTRLGRA